MLIRVNIFNKRNYKRKMCLLLFFEVQHLLKMSVYSKCRLSIH